MSNPKNIAIGHDGRPLQFTPEQVDDIVHDAISKGEILAAIMLKDGSVMVQIFGDPDPMIPGILENTARQYRIALGMDGVKGS